MDLRRTCLRIQQEARMIVYAVVRGDAVTVGAALGGLYLLAFAGLLNLFAVSPTLVVASDVAGLLCCGLAWVRAMRPALDTILIVTYLAGAAGFFVALALASKTTAVIMLCLVGATTIALTVTRLARGREGR
jgi:hypothetical protein